MTDPACPDISHTRATMIGAGAIMLSLTAQNAGAAFAKHLFPTIGAFGATGLRALLALIVLMALRRPWRRPPPRAILPALLGYGVMLGGMNVLIYQAIARLPIGIAVGLEVLGPLAVVLSRSRSIRDVLWLIAAGGGLILLLPLRTDARLDPLGVLFALGAATSWALYIVFGKRVSSTLRGDAVAWGMVVATLMAMPPALATAGPLLFTPWILTVALGVAVLSSAVPYSLEIEALHRLPAHVVGILLSTAPAVAALVGFVVLGEVLRPLQWLAIALIMAGSAGSAITSARRSG
ncbi:EamA family transporter [Novosphingobium sp. 9]|uniref:EamA family transporter n=1 Tax=Novosphingobium sp. 9 TaxID=2025349 RepID=UPI0021B567C0|nr:EamA family transporter [Novosphingobium sp. 9]